MGNFIQKSFVGGINRQVDSTRIKDNEYSFLRNGRNRYDVISTINSPSEITSRLPISGKIQGIYSAGSVTVVFVDGVPYGRDETVTQDFMKLGTSVLDPNVDVIYAEVVPASTVSWLRKLNSDEDIKGTVGLFGIYSTTPACMVAQDGFNQPIVIFPDGSTRVTQKYSEWIEANREYVPIGKQMLWHNGILYIVSSDGKEIYRSVTGRPLDFMVVIDKDGHKLTLEADGGATAVSHRVDYNPITCIRAAGTTFGDLVVTTTYNSYLVTPNYTETRFAEPTFSNTFLFDVGAVNQFSLVNLLGDNALITISGIRSFNAVLQTRYEGRNAPFSARVNDLFDGIEQTNTCAIVYDNYAFFSINTKFGQAVLVFDELGQVFSSMDQYTNIQTIVQFSVVRTSLTQKLLFRTSDNKIYEAFKSTSRERCQVYLGEFCSNEPEKEQQPLRLKLVYVDVKENGTVSATPYMDRLSVQKYQKFLKQSTTDVDPAQLLPFGPATSDNARVLTIDVQRARNAWKIGVFIEWDFDAKLSHYQCITSDVTAPNSLEQASQELAVYQQGVPTFESFSPIIARPNQIVRIHGTNLDSVLGVLVNRRAINHTIVSPDSLTIVIPDDGLTSSGYIELITDAFTLTSENFGTPTILTIKATIDP